MRETGSLLAHLGVLETSQVRKYFLRYSRVTSSRPSPIINF